MYRLLKETVNEFLNDDCMRFAASLAYYSLLSLPAILVLVLTIAAMVVGSDQAVTELQHHMREVMGAEGAEQVAQILQHMNRPDQGIFGWVISLGLLMVGASAVLSELQVALNRAWQVKPDPQAQTMVRMLIKRALSLVIVVAIAALLIASLMASWLLAEFAAVLQSQMPGWVTPGVVRTADQVISLVIVTLLFAAVYKFLPDVKLEWTDVWVGAFITALLFVIGKFGVSLYFDWADPTSAFGAAGSLALVLTWVYYSAMIFLFGAEFTQVYARSRGRRLKPEEGMVKDEAVHKQSALDC